jgi:hypothetical protein
MSDTAALLLSKLAFGGGVCVILYIIYYEWRSAQIKAEKAVIALGEKQNEDTVDNLTDHALVDLLNEDGEGGSSSSTPKKPT